LDPVNEPGPHPGRRIPRPTCAVRDAEPPVPVDVENVEDFAGRQRGPEPVHAVGPAVEEALVQAPGAVLPEHGAYVAAVVLEQLAHALAVAERGALGVDERGEYLVFGRRA